METHPTSDALQGKESTGRGGPIKYLSLAAVLIISAALLLQLFSNEGGNCSGALTDGHWSNRGWESHDREWVSHDCIHQDYNRRELESCFLRRSKVIFLGDGRDVTKYSTLRETMIDSRVTIEIVKQSDWSLPAVEKLYNELAEGVSSDPSVLVVHTLPPDSLTNCKDDAPGVIRAQLKFLKVVNGDQTPSKDHTPSMIAVLPPTQSLLGDKEMDCKDIVKELYYNLTSPLYYIDVGPPTNIETTSQDDDIISIEMLLTLNLFCNSPSNATCCITPEASLITYLSTCLLICILALYLGVWLIFISGATFALTPHLETLSFDFDRFFSLLHCVGGLAAILFYLLLADRLDFFVRADAPTSLPLFAVAIVTIMIAAMVTIKPADSNANGGAVVLSRDQCNEWRGWMILILIASHYTKTDKILMVRLMNELIVGVFLFLSGHAHFLSYWNSGELSWRKVLKGLLRTNVLCLCVCLTLGSSYGAYYLVAVLTHWYLCVTVFNALWPPINPTKLKRYTSPRLMVLIKFIITFVLLALLRFTKDFWLGVLSWRPLQLLFESFDGSTEDLFYSYYQQRYTAFTGMTFAYAAVTVGTTFKSSLAQYERQLKLIGAMMSLIIIMGYLMFLYTCDNGQECSSMQAYIGILPILAYVFLRNGSILHHFSSGFLAEAGSHSLWLFVSHFHILNALNGKGLLVFFPGYYYLNAVGVVIVYLYVFMVVRLSTRTLSDWSTAKEVAKNNDDIDDSNV